MINDEAQVMAAADQLCPVEPLGSSGGQGVEVEGGWRRGCVVRCDVDV